MLASRSPKSAMASNRLFELFAQGHQMQHNTGMRADNDILRVDWSTFCRKSLGDDTKAIRRWQMLVKKLIHDMRSCSMPKSMPMFDGSFTRSFQVGLALTTRALVLKGVSPEIVARTRARLRLLANK